jgi:hypothetical protein
MKRMLLASVLAVLGASVVLADDTGRASIRSAAATAPALAEPTAITPVSAVFNLGGGGCAGGSCNTCSCAHPGFRDGRLGLHPLLAKLMFWKKDCNSCKKCGGLFGPRCGGGGYANAAFNPYPNGVPGTLVFPQHPFVRSPRDFWMWEPK